MPAALGYYRDPLGFDITFQGPTEDDIFFGIVQHGAAMIMQEEIGAEPVPSYLCDIHKGIARWDAYLYVQHPDGLAAGCSLRNVALFKPLHNNDDGLKGFGTMDANG